MSTKVIKFKPTMSDKEIIAIISPAIDKYCLTMRDDDVCQLKDIAGACVWGQLRTKANRIKAGKIFSALVRSGEFTLQQQEMNPAGSHTYKLIL
jgi:hypothetical protein